MKLMVRREEKNLLGNYRMKLFVLTHKLFM